jgi:ubiquinone/menaquinone biosynthesis C-methylase UbiE
MKASQALAWLVLPALAWAQDTAKQAEMHHLHQDSKAYIAMLDDPKRDAHQKPDEIVAALKLNKGEVIADIGAGSGYFTFRLANQVGGAGRVYAVDVSPDMIVHLNRRIRELNQKNVVTILCLPDDPLLGDASISRFFICDTWHHIENHDHYLALLKKMLKSGGQVVMIDYKKTRTPVGPPLEMRIGRDELVKEMERNGFRLEAEHTFLPYQYFLLFRMK